jgi:hypothetical protein
VLGQTERGLQIPMGRTPQRLPETLPPWMSTEDVAYYAGEFRRTGFRGGLNWYRSIRRSVELLAPWRGAVIR